MSPKKRSPMDPSVLSSKNPRVNWPSCSTTIRLPLMTGREALHLIEVLGQLDRVVWRIYGDAMADELGLLGIEWNDPEPPESQHVPTIESFQEIL